MPEYLNTTNCIIILIILEKSNINKKDITKHNSMRTIKNIWILTESGTGVFFSDNSEQIKSHYFSMLLSALNSIANEISISGLTSFEFNKKTFNVLNRNGLLFVASSEKNFKKKNILQELESVASCFFEKYGENFVQSWDGDLEYCASFEEDLTRILPKQVQRIVEGLGWDY